MDFPNPVDSYRNVFSIYTVGMSSHLSFCPFQDKKGQTWALS